MSHVRRIAIFVHYAASDQLAPHAQLHLEKLRPLVERLVLVSNSPLKADSQKIAQTLCDKVMLRGNTGWDFAAWRDAIQQEPLENFDWTILTNSSVVGPVFPLGPILQRMESSGSDVWGMTRSKELASHIPSWFIAARKNVTASKAWSDFWQNVRDQSRKRQVIRDYEIGLSACLEKAGFPCGSVVENCLWKLEPSPRPPFLIWRNNDPLFDPIGFARRGVPYFKASLLWGIDQKRRFDLANAKASFPDFEWDKLPLGTTQGE